MQANDLWATAFRDTVEGKPGLCSVELTPDTGFLNYEKPRQEATKPRPELVVELLRSQIELTPRLRNIIADMLDPMAKSAFCFKSFGSRKPGCFAPWERWNMEAALFVEEQFVEKGLFESAVTAAMTEFDLARSTVTEAYSFLVEVRRIEKRNRK
jgi:hypothetical protein